MAVVGVRVHRVLDFIVLCVGKHPADPPARGGPRDAALCATCTTGDGWVIGMPWVRLYGALLWH
jgi:hypothetical protein